MVLQNQKDDANGLMLKRHNSNMEASPFHPTAPLMCDIKFIHTNLHAWWIMYSILIKKLTQEQLMQAILYTVWLWNMVNTLALEYLMSAA